MRALKNIFSIISFILGGIAFLVTVVFIAILFSTNSYTYEQSAVIESSHLTSHSYGEHEPSIESIIAHFVWNVSPELPAFPEFISPNREVEEHEWFETNGNTLTEIIENTLSAFNSTFSDVDFSIIQDEERDWIWILYADVKANLITDSDLIYLIHSVGVIGRRNAISTSFRIELNLDDGNQLFIEPRDAIAYTIAYREQKNEWPDQTSLDWWSIASGVIHIHEKTISWRGFVEDDEGYYVVRPLFKSPFD